MEAAVEMIVVAGEALVDLIVDHAGGVTAVPGGGPYNTARAIARLGRAVTFLGRISTDPFGRLLHGNLVADGVSTDRLVFTDDPTTLAVAALDRAGSATYRFYLDGTSAGGLTEGDTADLPTADVSALHVGTLGLVMEPAGSTIERLVGAVPTGALVMLDPNCRPSATRDPVAFRARIERIARRADVVKVSEDDLRFLAPDEPPDATIHRLLALGVGVVLRTEGGRAVEIQTAEERLSVPVPPVEVTDTVGAGDAFGGGFLAAWTSAGHGRSEVRTMDRLVEGVTFAIRVAAATCARPGADPPTLAELAADPA